MKKKALQTQVGGNHYAKGGIQLVEFCHSNQIPFMEGTAMKYLFRWQKKGGVEDLKKAKHYIDMIIELEDNKLKK